MVCEVIKKYGGSDKSMEILCHKLKEYVPENEWCKLAKDIYEESQGKHFDEQFAKQQISKMYYTENGTRHYAPYWSYGIYDNQRRRLLYPYNKWDFDVALNMIKSDNYLMLKQWFPNEDIDGKIVEMTINWLNDEDNTDGKIWKYFK